MGFLESIMNISDKKEIKRLNGIVDNIEKIGEAYKDLSDIELKNITLILKNKLKSGKTVDDILPEAFALVREASTRVLGMRPYRVQMIGGIVLHEGRIAEMKTGEGKTLVATAPAYLNALTGEGVHVVTVNDYLAKRDKEKMEKLYEFLGLSVGVIIQGQSKEERREQYKCDITYGTNNEYGFDYLKDNMVMNNFEKVQRKLNYTIIDEIDSILIDEARTPLIISGTGERPAELYENADSFILELEEDDYDIDEKTKSVSLTESGILKAEAYFNIENLTDTRYIELYHHINQALKAHKIMKKNIDYVVKNKEILIVDEFTGRIMDGRRFSDGLHQAIEAKEKVKINKESKTLATITYQNYFRMYNKISGMTGTAKTEEEEFKAIYNMDVVQIPTNKSIQREDLDDYIYKTEESKYNAIVEEILERNKNLQPVLVGTISVEKSEKLSKMLKKRFIKHEILNAKNHEKEAEIIAQAGRLGAVTIATNMAGRGTDILLGGNAEFIAKDNLRRMGYSQDIIEELDKNTENEELKSVKELYNQIYIKTKSQCEAESKNVLSKGGLCVIGTEKHETRRIDNQLRGRAGRQGDKGCSRFYISLEDEIMRLFGGEKLINIAEKMNLEENIPLENKILTKSIQSSQRNVESKNFEIRKNVLKYDDIINKQRTIIYKERQKVLDGKDVMLETKEIIKDTVDMIANSYILEDNNIIDIDKFIKELEETFNIHIELNEKKYGMDEIINHAYNIIEKEYLEKENEIGSDKIRARERQLLLESIDKNWIEHIDNMQQLKQCIGLRAIGQQDPVRAYTIEGYDMFEDMKNNIKKDFINILYSDINKSII